MKRIVVVAVLAVLIVMLLSNRSGGQIDLISPNKNPASGTALINWTLTYPQ